MPVLRMQKYNSDQEQLLKRITSLLDTAGIPYMITGSVSVIFYGRPRASHDIDFVVEAKNEDSNRIIHAFTSLPYNEFLIDPISIKEAILNKSIFQILHLPTMLKFDFWLLKQEPFDKERFKRKQNAIVFGKRLVFASPEDTILMKLLWYKESNIEKHLIDAAFIAQIQKKNLDTNYMLQWAKKHGTVQILEELEKIDLEQYY